MQESPWPFGGFVVDERVLPLEPYDPGQTLRLGPVGAGIIICRTEVLT